MPRPIKDGLDYFPLDVHNDDKLDLIEAEFGIEGWAIIIKLYQRIYKNSYFTKWTENELLLFKKTLNVDINLINVVINKALERGLFDDDLFKKHQILTSNGIQRRYIDATARRKGVSMISDYCLPPIIEYINRINANINLINSYKSTQSKVKESKVKESKVNILSKKINFLTFWELYDKKVGCKEKIKKKWDKLSLSDQKSIIQYIPEYIRSQPDKQYRKNPETFLNNRSWEDELIFPEVKLSKRDASLKGLAEAEVDDE